MLNRKGLVSLAAAAALACCGLAHAATSASSARDFALDAPVYAQGSDQTLLMGLLEEAGLTETYGLTVTGHLEAGYTYNFDNAGGAVLPGRVFDNKGEDPTFHQLSFLIQRAVDPAGGEFDIGTNFEVMYGADAAFIHSNGLFDANAFKGPENQVDFPQANLTFAVPVGNGMLVTVGKFLTPMGYEVINPTGNLLYSHSYSFGFAIPFTHTGFKVDYIVNDNLVIYGSVHRGWDQAFEDNNGDTVGYLVGHSYAFSESTKWYFNTSIGPEQANNDSNYRVVFDSTVTHEYSDQMAVALNGVFGFEADAAEDGSMAHWFGLAPYLSWQLSDMFSWNSRFEYFSDHDGARGLGTELYSVTTGLTILPFPNDRVGSNLKFRPEFRWDYSTDAVFDTNGDDHNLITVGGDVIFTF